MSQAFYHHRYARSFATWRSTKQTGTYDMKTFEIHALPVEPMEGLRPGMSVLVNLDELK